MYKYFISICFLFIFVDGFSQEQKKDSLTIKEKDSIVYKTGYGLRIGIDISKPIKAQFDGSYSGFEIVGDYRIKKNLYLAAEIGYEKETNNEDYTNSTAKGNYIRLGVNYNAYKNWLDMNNEIFVGYRYGFSLFEQTLNSYTPNTSSKDFGNYFPVNTITVPQTTTGLNAHWSELMIGIKAETFKNFFISFSASYKIMMSVKDPENFKSLYAPGFNRIFESNTGFGFNYTISYLIPFTKK
ncbi:hypothetical protein JL193_01250 [Polaribacter batillariae]|uniref:Outer membrane protein beta-barrel domain-containing protein n=1 Tax=Polaribacter batillariae TaxID=2808900 RepID=A0ABX7SUP7_9FLAO|nr:DUF6048 family protein [Polaribacter batillariae]QTD37960.1 hypothetical protein JL193_01250 [Polaribacter batillariae]